MLNQFQKPNQLNLDKSQLDLLNLLLVTTFAKLVKKIQQTVYLVMELEKTNQHVLAQLDIGNLIQIVFLVIINVLLVLLMITVRHVMIQTDHQLFVTVTMDIMKLLTIQHVTLVAHNVLNVLPHQRIVKNVMLIEFREVNQNVLAMMDMLK